ncbi:MAG: RNA:NAD 2'-phosphotransferase [uncultured Sulfurovum sp.]|uniref:Probable RNA 2'-phosphotransferase n=1 Tax=uncultured Sulfurovum sp. TaxID=269237 RepID=A0A6S6TPM2_9BACT|nr:MAG: RNA:NAD 2'-phosphotransferase [uncultured Sulfurovum sp.]
MKNNTKKISKFLSFILRHSPESIDLKLDAYGWADIDMLIMKSKEIKLTRALIEQVVELNDKQRFIIQGDKIRANQGHSINIDLALKAVRPPDVLYHGTATRFLDAIMQEGLNKQKRQHVHLSEDIETATAVGKRHGKVVILKVNAKKMFDEGQEFYLSENGVWLTDKVVVGFLSQENFDLR